MNNDTCPRCSGATFLVHLGNPGEGYADIPGTFPSCESCTWVGDFTPDNRRCNHRWTLQSVDVQRQSVVQLERCVHCRRERMRSRPHEEIRGRDDAR